MADSVDLDADSTYLLNKYFILPVLSLNTSVTNLDSTVNSFNNSSSVIANTLSITRLNASTLANTSSIISLNASILANTSSITTLNTSLSDAIDTVNLTTLTIGGTNGTSTQSYASALSSGTLSIANSQTNGILNIGTGNNITRSGAINIATVAGSTCPINILKSDGATTGGSVNIANGALQTTTVNIASGTGTGTVTIGNPSNTTNINSLTTEIRSLTTNIIGNTNIAINTQGINPTYFEFGSGTGNQIIDFHCNASYNVDYDSRIIVGGGTSTAGNGDIGILSKSLAISCPLTLCDGTISPTSGQLGYIIPNIYPTTTTLVNATDTAILLQPLSAGTWLLNYQFRLYVTTAGTTGIFLTKIISGAKSLAEQVTYVTENSTIFSIPARSGSVVVTFTTTTNVALQYYVSSTAVFSILGANTSPNDNTYLQCVRIA
jgi:hypothetical protein